MKADNVKLTVFLLLLSASFLLCSVPACSAENTVTWYFRSDYLLKETNTASPRNTSITRASATTFFTGYLGVRVYVDDAEVTSGVSAVVSRASAGSGLQTSTLSTSASATLGSSVVKVKVYMRLGTDQAWSEKAVFTSETLFCQSINGVWTFNFYTSIQQTEVNELCVTTFTFFFGSETYESRIEGVSQTEPTVYDWMFYQLRTGNFVGFITFPFVNLIGNLFYGLIVMLFCVPIYIRYRSTTVILFIITVLGGAGGIVTLMIPESGLGLAWLIFVFGLAALIYKVFR